VSIPVSTGFGICASYYTLSSSVSIVSYVPAIRYVYRIKHLKAEKQDQKRKLQRCISPQNEKRDPADYARLIS